MQLHAAIAAVTVPEMALEEDEAKQLALALAEIEKHYPINPLSPKHMAVLGLSMVVFKVYGKRIPAFIGKKKAGPVTAANDGGSVIMTADAFEPSGDANPAQPWFMGGPIGDSTVQ